MSTYAQQLAAVGLTPDNPDDMFTTLQRFIQNPKAYKDADKNWRGARDNLAAWEEPKGHYILIWPFNGGKWLDNAPKNDAQVRAVFKIPSGTSTAAFLSRIYRFPLGKPYSFKIEYWKGGGNPFDDAWSAVQNGIGSVVAVADTLHIPGANLYGALLTGKDPIAALKKDVDGFMAAGNIAKGLVSGDMGPLKAAITNGAAKFGVNLPPAVVDAAAKAYKSGDISAGNVLSMGPGYTDAWKVATNNGKLFDASLPAPPGLSYSPTAIPAQSTNLNAHPAIQATIKTPIHLALKMTPLKKELPIEAKAIIAANTGIPINSPLLKPKTPLPWWKIGGAGGGAAAGFMLGGPIGAAIGAGLGFAGGLYHDKKMTSGITK
jgi:hypothetical protein